MHVIGLAKTGDASILVTQGKLISKKESLDGMQENCHIQQTFPLESGEKQSLCNPRRIHISFLMSNSFKEGCPSA